MPGARLREHASVFTAEKVSEITRLPEEKIREAALLYATTKPAALHHRVAVEHNINSTQTDRALAILPAITGNLDRKGANVFPQHLQGCIPTVALAGVGPWLKPPPEVEKKRIGVDQYPLISGGRHIAYFHSEGRQVPSLRKLSPEPELEIHPETAAGLSLAQGDWAWVACPRIPGERAAFKVKHTPGLQTEVVHVSHGWWFPERPGPEHGCFKSNINVVISAEPPREEVCGSVPTRGTLCRIEKMEI